MFCDGDFWHGRGWAARQQKLRTGPNASYWVQKIARNRVRDREQSKALRRSGWTVIRLWETDILRAPETSATSVLRVVEKQRLDRRRY